MNRRIYSFFLFLFSHFLIHSQGQFNNWYFGTAGLNFFGANPTLLTNSAMAASEGSASISDKAGNLLFYTDGIYVWDKTHQKMPNGNGLYGSGSTTQSAVIVPMPGTTEQYYIFTADEEGKTNGLCYSIVDMKLNSGLGDIYVKNIPLHTPTTEKITAAKHRNGCDIWIISHKWESDNFYAYLVSSAGVSSPVISATGRFHGASSDVKSPIGYMKISPQGNKLAVGEVVDFFSTSSIELFDFNNSTGTVTNPMALTTTFWQTYGCEFSPNGNLLYGSSLGRVYQFDISSGSLATINASRINVGQTGNSVGALQIAPNGKIYQSRSSGFLNVINSPNVVGTGCNFVGNAVSLSNKMAIMGLPSFINSWVNASPGDITVKDSCEGSLTAFGLTDTVGVIGAEWNFGEPTSGANNISNEIFSNHTFLGTGTYTITLILNHTCKIDTVTKTVTIHPKPDAIISSVGTAECTGISNVTLSVDATGGTIPYFYSWSNGSSMNELNHASIGLHSATITDAKECKTTVMYTVASDENYLLFTPNTFTPNNDGLNDIFLPQITCAEKYELIIFDRWGNNVFKSTDPLKGWTGTISSSTSISEIDTYAWKIRTTDFFGEEHYYKGHVNALR